MIEQKFDTYIELARQQLIIALEVSRFRQQETLGYLHSVGANSYDNPVSFDAHTLMVTPQLDPAIKWKTTMEYLERGLAMARKSGPARRTTIGEYSEVRLRTLTGEDLDPIFTGDFILYSPKNPITRRPISLATIPEAPRWLSMTTFLGEALVGKSRNTILQLEDRDHIPLTVEITQVDV